MTKAELAQKLEQFVALGNELDAEAKRKYGPNAMLFHEADGGVFIMDGDSNGSVSERQKHIKHRVDCLHARWGAGAW